MKDLEFLEVGQRILEYKASELFEEATRIWKEKINFNSWSKWKKFWFNPHVTMSFFSLKKNESYFSEIKKIQMELLDKEVEEALND